MDVSQVCVSYPGSRGAISALRQVCISLPRGKVAMLMGPSGSGKSSLLSVMAGLLTPNSGDVILNGKPLYNLNPNDLARARLTDVGLIFQSFRLLSFLSVERNVALPLELSGMETNQALLQARKMLERVSLKKHAGEMPNQLSGGERQRVAIARAVVGHPSVLLADEPTANLDHKSSRSAAELIVECAREFHCAVLVVTHDPRLHSYADSHYELEDGVLSPAHTTINPSGF